MNAIIVSVMCLVHEQPQNVVRSIIRNVGLHNKRISNSQDRWPRLVNLAIGFSSGIFSPR